MGIITGGSILWLGFQLRFKDFFLALRLFLNHEGTKDTKEHKGILNNIKTKEMSQLKINPRFTILLIFIIVVAAMRIPNAAQVTAWSSFTPIGAMALFGGSYFNRNWKAFIFPLLTLFASDIIINVFVYERKFGIMHGGWYVIYAAFCVIVLLGKWLLKKVTVLNFILSAFLSTLFFWLIVDGGVWLAGGTDIRTMTALSRDFPGVVQCYLQGVPYMKNFLLGTLAYGGVMFGAFEWTKRYSKFLPAPELINN